MLIATATFVNESASGWQQANFAKPILIAAGTTYVASYYAPHGHYADDTGYFSSAYKSGPITVAAQGGVYKYGALGVFPSQTWQSSNYWVDVVFNVPSLAPSTPSFAPPPPSGGGSNPNDPSAPSAADLVTAGQGGSGVSSSANQRRKGNPS